MTTGLTEAFTELHPNITFDIETRPGGADGDNIVKTRLSTGEMSDVFFYNSGSLMQALNPEESMVEITGDPMLDDVVDAFIPTVTQNDKVFGVPFGTGIGGGILYNRAIFEEQGLEVPLTWEEFAANNEALKEAGITPVGASFGDTWTSQLFVLADYHNVAQAEPNFAEEYTANKAKYATTPAALTSFERLQEASDKDWWNEDYGSATFEDAQAMLLDGEIAQYPMLTFALPALAALDRRKGAGHRLLRPARAGCRDQRDDAVDARRRVHRGDHRPSSTRRRSSSPSSRRWKGPRRQTAAAAPAGPYLIEGATLPDDVAPRGEGRGGLHRVRQGHSGARVPVADQGTQPRAHHGRGRLRPAQRRAMPPRSTTRTSRSRPSNSASKAGELSSDRRCQEL